MTQGSIGDRFRPEVEELSQRLQSDLATALRGTDHRAALSAGADDALTELQEPLPEAGVGMHAALDALLDWHEKAGSNICGPRCYHFVIGGSTPASMGADLLATAWEDANYTWVTSPVGVMMEQLAMDWLKDLLGLPKPWPGVIVTGATMANFVCLAAGRQWWGEQHGVDVSDVGLAGLPQLPVLSSGHIHASTVKVLSLLGVGRGNIQTFSRNDRGSIDLEAFEAGLDALGGQPALIVANAGEVNAGEFDPVADMIRLARQHNCWVHVDGAFGLFARLSPRTAHLVEGVEDADSATVDGHKWLNVPFDSGYAFVRRYDLLAKSFRYAADYLPAEDDPRPTLGAIGPESSRRCRSFAVWATLKAYGREGHSAIVEHSLDMAQHLASIVDQAEDFERMAEVPLNIVALRYNPGGLDDQALDQLNARLGEALLMDGRFQAGTTRLGARTVFRPAFCNWRTRTSDLDEFLLVLRELGQQLA